MAASVGADGSYNIGAGFLATFANQTYLITVAHLATGQVSQSDDWGMWADEVHYAPSGQSAQVLPLFDLGSFGERRPRFKFLRAEDAPNILMDVIMLPLQQADLLFEAADAFDLPREWAPTYVPGQDVHMVGYQPWPEVKVQSHLLIEPGPVHLVHPPQTRGFSGGPVVDANGLLVGMPFGTEGPSCSGRGQLVAAPLIGRIANSVNGVD